jgi:two-component system, sensor histidine kinase
MFKSSITKFLIASLGILMTGLFVAALILAVQAWTNYSLAGRIARLTSTDRTLFTALVTVRAQIPKDSTALIAQDDPRRVMGATHREASLTVAAAVEALQDTDIADRVRFVTAIQTAWQKAEALQFTVEAQASRARAERNLHAIDEWREAVHGMTDTLSTASAAVGNAVRMGDPIIAEMVQIRRTAWTIRDRYGLQCSMLRPNVDRSLPLDARQLDLWHGDRAVYTAAWHTLDEFLLRPGVSMALRERIDAARAQTSQAQMRVDAIVDRFDRSGKPVVASAGWTELCDGPFDSILAIAQQAQDEANAHAEAIRTASSRMLLIAGVDLTSVIAFGVFAVVNVQRRLARPMKILTGAIARLSRREFNQAVPTTESPDELGSMAQALESLRTSALEAERLQLAMSRFTADASHQMRTPLTILRTHISVLGGLIPTHNAAYSSLKDIQEAADRLQRLLIQLLKLARADGGQSLDKESGTIDLREVIQEIAAKHVPQALEAGIDLHFEAEQRPFPAQANPITINEIFANLIDNAIRYNEAGGSVMVSLFDDNGRHVVDVEDDGPGIPDAEQEKVFTRFYRLNRDQSRVGSGLGLAIVRSLAATLTAEIKMSAGAGNRGLRVRVSFKPHGYRPPGPDFSPA